MSETDSKNIIEEINNLIDEDIKRTAAHYFIKDEKEAKDFYYTRKFPNHKNKKSNLSGILTSNNENIDINDIELKFKDLGIQIKTDDGKYKSWMYILDELSKEFKKHI